MRCRWICGCVPTSRRRRCPRAKRCAVRRSSKTTCSSCPRSSEAASDIEGLVSEWLSVADTAQKIAAGELTAVKVVDAALERIAKVDRDIGAYLAVDDDGARAAAKAIDAQRAGGQRPGPLAGVPIALKDVLVTRGLATTAASK